MDAFVLDASVAMSWCYPDEQSDYATRVLDLLKDADAVVPCLWPIEIANAVIVGERQGRLSAADVSRFFELLFDLDVATDRQTSGRALNDTLRLARKHGLSAYDATYLEIALRQQLPLATTDARLSNAAKIASVPLA